MLVDCFKIKIYTRLTWRHKLVGSIKNYHQVGTNSTLYVFLFYQYVFGRPNLFINIVYDLKYTQFIQSKYVYKGVAKLVSYLDTYLDLFILNELDIQPI